MRTKGSGAHRTGRVRTVMFHATPLFHGLADRLANLMACAASVSRIRIGRRMAEAARRRLGKKA